MLCPDSLAGAENSGKHSQGQLHFLVFITQQNRCHYYPQKKEKWLEVVHLTAEPGQGREERGLSCVLTSNATLCSFTTPVW